MFRRTGVLLVAHGTVEDLADLPAFLAAIARGRTPAPSLVAEMRRRYEAIGGSPLLRITLQLAKRVGVATTLPVLVGMRFGDASLEDALREAVRVGLDRLIVVPLAPFSVPIYAAAVGAARDAVDGPRVDVVEPWGAHPGLVTAFAEDVSAALREAPDARVLLTAHSLPRRVIDAGDPYVEELRACATAVASRVGRPHELVFQSAGAGGGEWVGPLLDDVLARVAADGGRRVVISPIGFLSEHVETLYDLDIEAKGRAAALGLEFVRVPALGADPRLVGVVADLVARAIAPGPPPGSGGGNPVRISRAAD